MEYTLIGNEVGIGDGGAVTLVFTQNEILDKWLFSPETNDNLWVSKISNTMKVHVQLMFDSNLNIIKNIISIYHTSE